MQEGPGDNVHYESSESGCRDPEAPWEHCQSSKLHAGNSRPAEERNHRQGKMHISEALRTQGPSGSGCMDGSVRPRRENRKSILDRPGRPTLAL